MGAQHSPREEGRCQKTGQRRGERTTDQSEGGGTTIAQRRMDYPKTGQRRGGRTIRPHTSGGADNKPGA